MALVAAQVPGPALAQHPSLADVASGAGVVMPRLLKDFQVSVRTAASVDLEPTLAMANLSISWLLCSRPVLSMLLVPPMHLVCRRQKRAPCL
jgi:hypothetical protein